MNAFERFIASIEGTMTTPSPYGWFHLMCFGITIALCVGLGFAFRKAKDKTIRIFILILCSIFLIFEIYKQLVYSYDASKDIWDYQWYIFPFQFCSVPMYVGLIAGCLKQGKFRDHLYSFLATYSLLAGLIVMLLPTDVFTTNVGVNIQTMVHHGGMVVMGVVLLASKSVEFKHKTILKASLVFAVLVSFALLFDCVYIWAGGTETCNLFFISPYGQNHFPILSTIQATCPYIVFLISYLFAFSTAAYIVLLVAMGINKIIRVCATKRQKKANA